LKKLEKNWARWKGKAIGEREAGSFSGVGTLREGYCYSVLGYQYFSFSFIYFS